MLNKTFPYFLLLLLLAGNSVFSQENLTLTGKVLDKKTNRPVPFAHIGIPERGIGTTTGFDGGFEFKLPKAQANAELTVSCMGYDTYSKPVGSFKNGSVIYLDPSVNQLAEVVVMDKKAIEDIIRRAVKAIPKNYPTESSNTLAFYRESLTDDSLRYKYLAEGVLKVYKNSYKNDNEGQVGLVQGRKINLKDPLDTSFYSGLSSGHMAAHRFDFVKNREDFIDEAFFPVYKYWIENITTYNGRKVFIIGFDKETDGASGGVAKQKKRSLADRLTGKNKAVDNSVSARMKGRIFIEQESYAFIRAEFEITKEGLRKGNDYPLYVGSWKANKYVVNYRQHGKKWYFSDALREGVQGNGGHYANEVKTTEINPEQGNAIPYLERLQRGDEFVQLTGSYDEDFWKNYNITPMSEGLAEGMKQYKNMLKAQEAFSEANRLAIQQMRDSIEAAELLRKKAELAKNKEITQEQLEDVDYVPESLRKVDKVRNKFAKVRMGMGLGTHLISSGQNPLGISYFDGDGDQILSLDGKVPQREFEVIGQLEFDIAFRKNWFMRFGWGFDFWNSIYKDRAIGFGFQVNLRPKHRPIILRTVAQYSYLRYYRKLGNAENDYGRFKVERERFRGDEIRLSYGSRFHIAKLSAELSIELHRHRELYFRGSYHYAYAHHQDVWFKETRQPSRKDHRLPVSSSRLEVVSKDAAFGGRIAPLESLSFTVGL
ncbi:MAG: carboxypeptidase-like regulatory domain-containing protein, partial [Saprospiraceae bacterium]|nr:carboxypeptidase-like regulatory domain-containing protein [Saprospiraceae bacterium]